jgi:osmotically-inducible protein OsmY
MYSLLHKDQTQDRAIADRAHACLQQSPYHAVRLVTCDYHRGVLFLRGRVPDFYRKQLAQEAVLHVEGVCRVVNEIEVSP